MTVFQKRPGLTPRLCTTQTRPTPENAPGPGIRGDPGHVADAKMSLEKPDADPSQVGCYSEWKQAKPQMGDTPEE